MYVTDKFQKGTFMFQEYRKKPVVVTAAQWTDPANPPTGIWDPRKEWKSCCPDEAKYYGKVTTLEGTLRINLGDYLITGVKGEIYPCREDIFLETYEPVESDL